MAISTRKLGKIARKLRVRRNSIVLIRSDSELAQPENLQPLMENIGQLADGSVIVLVVDDFSEIDAKTEREMNKLGWYRIQKILDRLEEKGAGDDTTPQPAS